MKNRIQSIKHALRGFRKAYKNDTNFRLEVWGGSLFIGFGYFLWPLEVYEILFLALSYILILTTELINTAFETAFKRLHPEHDEFIGASKDIAAAAVFSSAIFAGIVVSVIFFNNI